MLKGSRKYVNIYMRECGHVALHKKICNYIITEHHGAYHITTCVILSRQFVLMMTTSMYCLLSHNAGVQCSIIQLGTNIIRMYTRTVRTQNAQPYTREVAGDRMYVQYIHLGSF